MSDQSKTKMGCGAKLFAIAFMFCIGWVLGWIGYAAYADQAIGPQRKGQAYIDDMAVTQGWTFGILFAFGGLYLMRKEESR